MSETFEPTVEQHLAHRVECLEARAREYRQWLRYLSDAVIAAHSRVRQHYTCVEKAIAARVLLEHEEKLGR